MAWLMARLTLGHVGERLARPTPVLLCEYMDSTGMFCSDDIREGDIFEMVMTAPPGRPDNRRIWCAEHSEEREG